MDIQSFEKAKIIFKEMTRRELEDFIPSSLTQINIKYEDLFLNTKTSFPLSLSNPLLVSSDPFADIKIQGQVRFLFQIQKFQGLEIQVSTSAHSPASITLNNTRLTISLSPSTLFINFQNLDQSTLSCTSGLHSFSFSFSS